MGFKPMKDTFEMGEKRTGKDTITTKGVAIKVLTEMKNHIGNSNPISRKDLFFIVYNVTFKNSNSDFIRWITLKRAMTYIRQHSQVFIVFERIGTDYVYFVAKTRGDEKFYVEYLTRTIKSYKKSIKKVYKAIDEKWYKKDWIFDTDKKRGY